MPYVLAVLVALLLASIGGNAFLYNEVKTAKQNEATAKAAVQVARDALEEQKQVVKLLEDVRQRDQVRILELGKDLNKAERERQDADAKLNRWRNELAREAISRPEVVGRAATSAINRRMRKFAETPWSGEEDRGDRKDPSATSKSTIPSTTGKGGGEDRGRKDNREVEPAREGR